MRKKFLLLALGFFLTLTSCDQKPASGSQPPETNTMQGKYQLGRIAGREYRYDNATQCKTEAEAFFRGSYSGPTTEVLTLVTLSPAVYSMKAKNEDVEIRFAVVSTADLALYGNFINYYEVNKTPGHTDQEDIDEAAKEFKVLPDDILRGAFQDELPVEKSGRGGLF